MSISYPLALPTISSMSHIGLMAKSIVGVSASPFTGQQQVYAHQGQWWEAQVSLPSMVRAAAEVWVAFLLSLNGREGTFLMGDPVGRSARGAASGTPLINGVAQTGQVLTTKGWTPSVTGILKAGDWIQLGTGLNTRLHKVLADVNSDVGGLATLDIWPRLRYSPADSDPIIVTNAAGLWRLSSNEMPYDIGSAQIYGINFSCMEAL